MKRTVGSVEAQGKISCRQTRYVLFVVEQAFLTMLFITLRLKRNSCWYCRGIEDHKIVSVKTVVDEFGRELPAYDTPYNYCPVRPLAGEKEGLTDADERTDTSQDARL